MTFIQLCPESGQYPCPEHTVCPIPTVPHVCPECGGEATKAERDALKAALAAVAPNLFVKEPKL